METATPDRYVYETRWDILQDEGGTVMPNITLTFTKEQYDNVMLICRRKKINLADYIVDNFEWDGEPYCIEVDQLPSAEVCEGCEFSDRCPDFAGSKE